MCTLQYRRDYRRQRSIQSLTHRGVRSVLCERPADERFARSSTKNGKAQHVQLVKPPQERVILFKILSEPESRIKHDLVAIDPGCERVVRPIRELALHQ